MTQPLYENLLQQNQHSEGLNSLSCLLSHFETFLLKYDKVYRLHRRRDKTVATDGLTLFDVFQMIKDDYSGHDIALRHGISDTYVKDLKRKIRVLLKKFGIYWSKKPIKN
jgi:hypothetical protein